MAFFTIYFLSILQVHGKDAVLAYDSDEDSISEATSPTSHAANPLSSPASEPHNNNNDSSHISQQPSQHASVAPPHTQHQPPSAPLAPAGASLTGLSSHFNGSHGGQHYYHNQMPSHDFKPQYLSDWYSHGMTAIGSMSRYDPAAVSAKPAHHVSSALPTPPSTGHSPIQSLSNHLHLLPSTTTAYT